MSCINIVFPNQLFEKLIDSENILHNVSPSKHQHRKVTSCKSSKTHFAKVSRRSKVRSGGNGRL